MNVDDVVTAVTSSHEDVVDGRLGWGGGNVMVSPHVFSKPR